MEIVTEYEGLAPGKVPQKKGRSVQSHQVPTELDQETRDANLRLREQFLGILERSLGSNVEIELYGGAKLGGRLSALDPSTFRHYLIDGLRTPTGIVEHAALRFRDTILLELPEIKTNC